MAESFSSPPRRPAAISRRIGLARAAICWEDLLTRTWRAMALLAVLLGLTLMGVWTWLPGELHIALVLVFIIAIPVVLWRDLCGITWPDEEAALRRLETKSGFDHRPLLAVEDSFAGDPHDPQSRALFEAHRKRMAERIRAVKVGRPLSNVSTYDRLALRSLAVMVLAIGVMAGWSHARANMISILHPDFSRTLVSADIGELTLWITPPAYTGVPPLWLDALELAADDAPVAIPAGSELVAQIRGGDEAPVLVIDDQTVTFEPAGLGSYQIVHVFEEGSHFSVTQSGHEIAAWPINVIPDALPQVALSEPPSETLRTSLRLDVVAADDYGLASIQGVIKRIDVENEEVLAISIPISQVGVKDVEGPAFYDFTAHPWAGMELSLELTVTDNVGQSTTTDPIIFQMPERYFLNPLARSISDQRKRLVLNPAMAKLTKEMLEGLANDPEAYLDDFGVHLALVTGSNRLEYAQEPEAARAEVIELMWDTALAIEEGPLAFAERRVRELQEELLDALTEGASDEEIERLLDELRLAMEDYMRALSNRLRTDPGELFDPTDALKAVGSRELTDLVDQIRDLLRSGSPDQAQTLLTRLQEIIENISVGNLSDLTGNMSAEVAEVIHTLRQLMSDQQELLDETFRMLREEEPDDFSTQDEAGRQGQMQAVLQDLMGRLDEFGYGAPGEFSRADRSMERSVRRLEADRPGQSVDHQTEALEHLRSGADSLMEEMMEQAGEDATGDGRNFFAAPRDPMGRHMGGSGEEDTSDFTLPDRGAIIKAREILNELYKRAGEQYRPLEEREYLQRLLRRF
jgi:uncharacterized protein (TIGR02302 family)